ncbi:MFS transporter [Bacillus dakarensis]|uniref:MFS transporter n=1 Tax=Robertmurraya dakarensis TaxID=1926278 RepID=UPI0009FE9C07|nr:MFS transporter [Bacillus dakarensis]
MVGKMPHKGWLMLFLIVLSVLASLGFGRFSFGAIFPFMRDGLDINYQQAGALASSIFLGYLVGVINVGYFVMRFTAKKTILYFLLLVGVSMIFAGTSNHYWVVLTACFFMGIGSGGVYIPSLELVRRWFHQDKRGMAMGITMAGGGIGMVFSGITVPFLVTSFGKEGWRVSWWIIAAVLFVITFFIAIFLKNSPEDIQLQPIGHNEKNNHRRRKSDDFQKTDVVYRNKLVWSIGIVYFLWGVSYLIFSTFLVDYFISDLSFSNERAGFLFSIGGIASIISGFIWGTISDRMGRMLGLSFVYFIQTFVLLGLTLSSSYGVVFILVILYGLTLWGVPTIMNASIGDLIIPTKAPAAMGFITLFFSVGQLLSPVMTGYLVELGGNYTLGLFLSMATCILGGIGSIMIHLNLKTKILKQVSADNPVEVR